MPWGMILAMDEKNRRMLSHATRRENKECLRLLAAGADVNYGEPAVGLTALHYAARDNNLKLCEALIRRGAIVDAQTRRGRTTPLRMASEGNHAEACALLIFHGATPTPAIHQDIARMPGRDRSALVIDLPRLHAAAVLGDCKRLLKMLEKGADPLERSPAGQSAAEVAQHWNHEAAADLLRSWAARHSADAVLRELGLLGIA